MVVLSNLPAPEDGIRHSQPDTKAFIENRDLGSGTLYIAERYIYLIIKTVQPSNAVVGIFICRRDT